MRHYAARLPVLVILLLASFLAGCGSTSQAADAAVQDSAGGSNTLTDAVLVVVLEDLIPAEAARLAAENIRHDETGRLADIGFSSISYDDLGRIERVGTARVLHNADGLPIEIGGRALTYNNRDQIARIGDVIVTYERGRLVRVGDEMLEYGGEGSLTRIGDRAIVIVGGEAEATPAN